MPNVKNIIDNFLINMTDIQKKKIDYLKSFFNPYSSSVYIVGGFLRDQILGIQSDDIDIEVYDIQDEIFYKLMDKLGAKELNKKFFVYNYLGIDISLPRLELKNGEGYHGFKMEVTNNPFEAVQRRDFTCNSLMYNIFENKLYDYCGGFDDIKNKILKVVNKEKFIEDDVRFLRAIRMKVKFGFLPDKTTKELLWQMNLENITKTKIAKELKKIL